MDTGDENSPLLRSRLLATPINSNPFNRALDNGETPTSGILSSSPSIEFDDESVDHLTRVISSNTFLSTMEDSDFMSDADNTDNEEHQRHDVIKAGFESLDYEVSDNLLYQQEEREKSSRRLLYEWRGARRWMICILVGIFTGLTASLIDYGVEKLSALKYSKVKDFLDSCVTDKCMYLPMIIWILFNMGLVLVGAVLTAFVEPVAAGSGIPQIKCYLNGVIVPHVVRIKTLITKVIGVLCAVAGGLPVGKEGPMIHSGAVIGAGISQGRATSINLDCRLGKWLFRDFRSDTEKRDFVSAGAAAGVSAAFGAPVGGVLFSLEEGASFWNQALVWRIFFCSMISMISLNIVQSYIKGHHWDLSYPGLINFGQFQNVQYKMPELFVVICMGVFGGLSGALFNHINYKLTQFRMRFVTSRWLQVLEVLMVAAYTGCFGYVLIYFSNDCMPLTENRETTLIQFFCRDGEYSSSARLFFDTPEQTVKHLFHSNPGSYEIRTLVIFATGYFFLACWTYGLSIPSGLFIPCLLVGAAWGRVTGIIVSSIITTGPSFSLSFYSLVGASAQLGGIVRMTISLTVIIMEATASVTLGLPVMISLIIAKWVGDRFNEGIYDLHIHLQGVPLLGWEPLPMSKNMSAKTVMSHPVTVLRMREKVDRIIHILKTETHNGFPVVEDYDPDNPKMVDDCQTFGQFKGLILRSQLTMILKKKLFEENPHLHVVLNKLRMKDFNEHYPRYTPIQQISVSPEESQFTINLSPFINQSHYVVLETASYASIFTKFRSLGLRHMVVINFFNEVIGIVTRKDLARYMMEFKDGEISIQEKTIIH